MLATACAWMRTKHRSRSQLTRPAPIPDGIGADSCVSRPVPTSPRCSRTGCMSSDRADSSPTRPVQLILARTGSTHTRPDPTRTVQRVIGGGWSRGTVRCRLRQTLGDPFDVSGHAATVEDHRFRAEVCERVPQTVVLIPCSECEPGSGVLRAQCSLS